MANKAEDIAAAYEAATRLEMQMDSGRLPELVMEVIEEDGRSVPVVDTEARGRASVKKMMEVLEARGWRKGFGELELEDRRITMMTRDGESLVITRTEWGQVYIED